MQILLSNSQAGPGRTVKQQQEQISRNHVQAFIPGSVHSTALFIRNNVKLRKPPTKYSALCCARRREGKHNSQFSAAHIITRQSMLPRCPLPSQLPEIRSYDAVSELGGYQFQDARQFYTPEEDLSLNLWSVRASNFCVLFGTWW